MLLATKCPHCKTTFKVANDQLKLQSGLVRCGVCNQVFNGIEHLAPANAATSTSASIKINPAAPAVVDAVPKESVPVAPPPAVAKVTEPPIETLDKSGDNRELDLFESLNIIVSREPEPEPEPEPERAMESEPTMRLEPVLESEEPPPAESLYPAQLKSEFVRARSDEELGLRVQALLDQDMTGEPPALPPIVDDFPLISTEPTLNADGHEEIVISKIEDLDNTFSTAPIESIETAVDMDALIEPSDDDADDEYWPDDEKAEPVLEAKPKDLRALLGHAGDDESAVPSEDDEFEHLLFVRQARNRQRLKWVLSIGTMLLLLTLVGQFVYQFRDLIAVSYPPSKESLVLFCKVAGCQVKLPAQLDMISKDVDELHTLPRPGTFEFSTLLKNHGNLPQAWPSIELILKDSKKAVVLKKVFAPGDYLADPHDELAGFQPNSEQSIKMYFVVTQVQATDYVASIFYP